MSKVVHLSEDAHTRAKEYCKKRGLRMSDWVASLIEVAIAGDEPEIARPGLMPVPRRKELIRYDDSRQTHDDGEPVYAAPPFWKKAGER